MKVVCVNKFKLDIDDYDDLTVGEVYDVFDAYFEHGYEKYEIKDDSGSLFVYRKMNFITLAEYREQRLKEIFE